MRGFRLRRLGGQAEQYHQDQTDEREYNKCVL